MMLQGEPLKGLTLLSFDINICMCKKYQVIRGKRILQQLQQIEEQSTFAELERNTTNFIPPSEKRQWATDPIQIDQMQLIPYEQSSSLMVQSVARNDEKKYQTIILFNDVTFEQEDTGQNVTFRAPDNQEHNVQRIQLNQSTVKVKCDCLDFRWRFAIYNAEDNSLYGDSPGLYQKTTNRPPNNPRNVPGVCKHLLKTVQALQQSGLVS